MTQSTIKVSENILIKYQRLKIEGVTRMEHCFTICRFKTEKPTNIEIFTPFSLEIWLFCCKTGMPSLDKKYDCFANL